MADRPIIRRFISISAVAVALPLWVLLSPIWLVVSIVVDVGGRLWRFPTLRLCVFAIVYLLHEWAGVIAAGWLWLTGSFGRNLNLNAHRAVQGWWATSLLTWAERLLGVRLDFGDLSALPKTDIIVLSRHASMVDAIIPVTLIAHRLKRFVHYAIKKELLWDPALDLYGTRLRNHFVARGGDTDAEEEALYQLAAGAEPDSALVIFPEGTYATPKTRSRVLTSLRRIGDVDVVARAEALKHLLPPKPAGTLAMLRGRPDAEVVVVGHVGLEGVAELKGLRRRLPLSDPVLIRWWVHRRHDLPSTEDALTDWLGERWLELDRWVAGNRPSELRTGDG